MNKNKLEHKIEWMKGSELIDILIHYKILTEEQVEKYYDDINEKCDREEEKELKELAETRKKYEEESKRICRFCEWDQCSALRKIRGFLQKDIEHRCKGRQKDIDVCPIWQGKKEIGTAKL